MIHNRRSTRVYEEEKTWKSVDPRAYDLGPGNRLFGYQEFWVLVKR